MTQQGGDYVKDALTAAEQRGYERGVRQAAERVRQEQKQHTRIMLGFANPYLDSAENAILSLLDKKGVK